MKKTIHLIIAASIYVLSTNAQWMPDVRLTNDSADSQTSYNNAWCVATLENFVYVVWSDARDGNYEIYYKYSIDSGINWGIDTRLTEFSGGSAFPSISLNGSMIHIVWTDTRDGNNEIYYKYSTNRGINWSVDKRLSNNSAESRYPSISVNGSFIHTVWEDNRNGFTNLEIYYKCSSNNGISWGQETRLTNSAEWSHYPSIATSGSGVHVVWHDLRDNNWEIYYKRSTDNGVTWITDARLTNNSAYSEFASVCVNNSTIHVVWVDWRYGEEIYYKHSTDSGVSWGNDVRLTYISSTKGYPSIAVSGMNVHVVWKDTRDVNDEIYYKGSTNGGINWGADSRLTNNSNSSLYPSMSVSDSVLHVVWEDYRHGNYEIYYKRNPTGNPNGINYISSDIPNDFKLEQNIPNPFNPNTKIKFQIPKSAFVNLEVYDALGKYILTLVSEFLNAGEYEATWNGVNQPSGIYFYKMTTADLTQVKKMVLIK